MCPDVFSVDMVFDCIPAGDGEFLLLFLVILFLDLGRLRREWFLMERGCSLVVDLCVRYLSSHLFSPSRVDVMIDYNRMGLSHAQLSARSTMKLMFFMEQANT